MKLLITYALLAFICSISAQGEEYRFKCMGEVTGLCDALFDTRISFMGTSKNYLALDTSRIQECIEAWIPAISPYGPGIIILDNSD